MAAGAGMANPVELPANLAGLTFSGNLCEHRCLVGEMACTGGESLAAFVAVETECLRFGERDRCCREIRRQLCNVVCPPRALMVDLERRQRTLKNQHLGTSHALAQSLETLGMRDLLRCCSGQAHTQHQAHHDLAGCSRC